MLSLNTLTNFLVTLIAALGFAKLLWYLQKPRMVLRAIPVAGRNGRYYAHQMTAPPNIPYYNLEPVTHDSVVNSMNDGMIVLDNQKRIIDINPSARRIIQKSKIDLVGKPISSAWPTLATHFQAAKIKPFDIALGAKENKRFYELSIMPFCDERQEQHGHLLILRDITERIKLEHMREDLTRTMVHDLRDPISNSLFALEMLKSTLREGQSTDAQQLLDLTFASTAKTLQLVDKILEIGRLESGEMPLSLTAVPLAEMVHTIISAQTPRTINKQLQLVNHVSDSLPPVWADADLLERVLKNLIDNSIKFTPNGGTIRVTAALHDNIQSDQPCLHVSISDTGPGIPPALQPKIFGQFVTGADIASGSGLGLSFCKMALAAHGQDIWIDSASDEGATFIFSLPISPTAQPF